MCVVLSAGLNGSSTLPDAPVLEMFRIALEISLRVSKESPHERQSFRQLRGRSRPQCTTVGAVLQLSEPDPDGSATVRELLCAPSKRIDVHAALHGHAERIAPSGAFLTRRA
jgi:hypothetical protein